MSDNSGKVIFLIIFILTQNVAISETKNELLVSAAMSLKDVFSDLGKKFETKNNRVKIFFNFAGSGQLRAQIENGAPADIFASASQRHMNILEKKKFIHKLTRKDFTKNSLVLIKNIKSRIILKTIPDLKNNNLKKIALGNPKTVPAGQYAKEAMSHFHLYNALKNKLIYVENVRQVLDYVIKNEVDVGFVFLSDIVSSKEKIKFLIKVPADSHKSITYPIAIIKNSKNKDLAQKFIQFITAEGNKALFKEYGFY